MKLFLYAYVLIVPVAIFSCERERPPQSLREMYGLEELRKLQKEGSTKIFQQNIAIAYDDLEALKILFAYGKDLQKLDYKDYQLSQYIRAQGEPIIYFNHLHIAARFGATQVLAFCLEQKNDANALTESQDREHDKNTPAHLAVLYEKRDILVQLLDHGIALDLKNGAGKTIEDVARDKKDAASLALIAAARKKRDAILAEIQASIKKIENM